MKHIKLIFLAFLVMLSTSLTVHAGSVSYITARYDMSLPLSDESATSKTEWMGLALLKAEAAIAKTTYSTSDYSLTQKLIKVQERMKDLVVSWSDEPADFELCLKNLPAGGYNFAGTPIIYLCRAAIDQAKGQSDYLAQVIIHEAAHAADFEDECTATQIEVHAARLSDLKLQFTNTYWATCNIK